MMVLYEVSKLEVTMRVGVHKYRTIRIGGKWVMNGKMIENDEYLTWRWDRTGVMFEVEIRCMFRDEMA